MEIECSRSRLQVSGVDGHQKTLDALPINAGEEVDRVLEIRDRSK